MSFKKGQLDIPILTFAVIVIALIIFAPIMLKVFKSIQVPLSSSLGNVSTEGGAAFDAAITPLVTWWDKIMIFAFTISVILLLISAFFIDTHPFWVILYIIIVLFVVIFSSGIITAADNIYESSQFAGAGETNNIVNQIPFMDFLRNNFGFVLMGIVFITGIIMYGKIAWFPNNGRGGGGTRWNIKD